MITLESQILNNASQLESQTPSDPSDFKIDQSSQDLTEPSMRLS